MKSINARQIAPFVAEGLVSCERHPEFPWTIYNYTHKCQFTKRWTDTTKACRGLILHDDGRVIARPFPKFFNLDEMSKSWNPPSKTFTVTTKEDGSLGILYQTPTGIGIATRGSFSGPQAVKATAMAQAYRDLPWDTDRLTYLFEVIYPENRIVVDYGDTERLVLLAVIETATGKDAPLPAWYPHHVQSWPELTNLRTLRAHATPNAEGFVVRFTNSTRVKVKFDEYVRLHRLITGVNAKTIWEHLANGEGITDLIECVPDEFYDWVARTAADLRAQFETIQIACERVVATCSGLDRKAAAEIIVPSEYPAPAFAMLDGKDWAAAIWRLIKPEATRPFRRDNDA